MWDPFSEFEEEVLPNGLTVHVSHWPDRLWQGFAFVVHSGALEDRDGLQGTAHFLEHLVSRNTDMGYNDIRDFFADNGGEAMLGATSQTSTWYSCFLPLESGLVEKSLDIFGSMLFPERIEKLIEAQRSVILEEFRRKYPIPYKFKFFKKNWENIFNGHKLARSVSPLGYPESIKAITKEDLQAFYDTHYTPANVSLVTVGGLSKDEVIKRIQSSPLSLEKFGVRTPAAIPLSGIPKLNETRAVLQHGEYSTGEGITTSADYETLSVLPGTMNREAVSILRSMISEQVLREIREKRSLTYSAGASESKLRFYNMIIVHCDSLPPESLDEVEKIVEEIIAGVGSNKELFEIHRKRAIARYKTMDLDGRSVIHEAVSDIRQEGRIVSIAEEIKKREAVTLKDVQEVANCLTSGNRLTIISKP